MDSLLQAWIEATNKGFEADGSVREEGGEMAWKLCFAILIEYLEVKKWENREQYYSEIKPIFALEKKNYLVFCC